MKIKRETIALILAVIALCVSIAQTISRFHDRDRDNGWRHTYLPGGQVYSLNLDTGEEAFIPAQEHGAAKMFIVR